MLVNIGEILSRRRKSAVIDTSIDLDDINLNKQNLKFVDPPVVKGKILDTDGKLVFTGKVSANIQVPCDMCAKMVDMSVDTEFEVHLTDDKEAFVMEYDTYVYTADYVDITDLIAIEIIEELPIKILCKEDCKGLCQFCGTDLNIGSCNCTEDEKVIDIRLQKLQEILK